MKRDTFFKVFVLVLLSANVERFSVSRVQDFLLLFYTPCWNILSYMQVNDTCLTNNPPPPSPDLVEIVSQPLPA